MLRKRIPTAIEIRRLLQFLLGRQPSDRAIVELSQRPLGYSADLILLGSEFEGVARRGVLQRTAIPHHRQPFAPTPPELRWVEDLFGLSSESSIALAKVQDWLGFLALLLRDPSLLVRMQTDWREHAAVAVLTKLMTDVAALHPTADAAASLVLPRPTTLSPTSQRPSPKRVVEPGSILQNIGQHIQPKAKREPKKNPPNNIPDQITNTHTKDEPEAFVQREGRITGPWLNIERAEALWRQVLDDPSSPRLRGDLFNAFRADEKSILYLHARLVDVPTGRCAPYDALIHLLAARLYLRLFMARSAWEAGNAAVAADAFMPGALRPNDHNRLHKTLATAALRTGRVDHATLTLQGLLRSDPLDWEAHMALADVIAGSQPARATELYAIAMHLRPELGPSGRFSVAEFLYSTGERIQARKIVLDMMREGLALPECYLALSNMALSENDLETSRARITDFFREQDISPPNFVTENSANHLFSIGPSQLPRRNDHPLVSIIMTAWNAAETIESSIQSVLDQTFSNIELLIVDDCSVDNTEEIVCGMIAKDNRVKFLKNSFNSGTYCSKNRAIAGAKGDYITLHDSDDWMHPQRIEFHLEAMQRGCPAASMSNWVRMEESGRSVLRKGGGGYVHRNPASTFIRREVFDKIGFFDSVRVGADSEMLWRMRDTLGPDAVLDMEMCLGIGLHHENSLTQSGVTAFDEFRFSPVRLEYAEAWGKWHISQLVNGHPLYIPFPVQSRPFDAPKEIVVISDGVSLSNTSAA